jgi:hypothetical protein
MLLLADMLCLTHKIADRLLETRGKLISFPTFFASTHQARQAARRFDLGGLHLDSLAKYAAAFFKISFSSRRLATSRRHRVTSAVHPSAGGTTPGPVARPCAPATPSSPTSSLTSQTTAPPQEGCACRRSRCTAAVRNSAVTLLHLNPPQGQFNMPHGVRLSATRSLRLAIHAQAHDGCVLAIAVKLLG